MDEHNSEITEESFSNDAIGIIPFIKQQNEERNE